MIVNLTIVQARYLMRFLKDKVEFMENAKSSGVQFGSRAAANLHNLKTIHKIVQDEYERMSSEGKREE